MNMGRISQSNSFHFQSARNMMRLACLLMVLTASPRTLDAQTDSPSPHPRPGIAYASLNIPDAIRPDELKWYGELKTLDDAQAKVFHGFFDSYLGQDHQLRESGLQQLYEQAATVGGDAIFKDRNLAHAFAEFIKERNRFVDRLAQVEEQLLAGIEPLLADIQRPGLRRARLQRERVRCNRSLFEYPYFSRYVDLSVTMRTLGVDHEYQASLKEAFDIIMLEYEIQATSLCQQRFAALQESVSKTPQIFASTPPPDSNEADLVRKAAIAARHHEGTEESRRLARRVNFFEIRLHELNVQTVDRVSSVMTSNGGLALRSKFRESVYPAIYPDPFDLEPILTAVSEIASLNGQQAEILGAIRLRHVENCDNLSHSMVDRFLSFRREYLHDRVDDPEKFAKYKADMIRLQEQRKQNANATLQLLRELLQSDQQAQVASMLSGFERAASEHVSREQGIDFRP